ncbi:hypothetical protein [Mycolicibacterium diernhoferi]|nr:hypothetical protein [Mycolicibacterium diernhoferi]QYL25855.1 hypothetical protein K0O62_02070 [Mycolicibacterium diernhoferi]
MAVAISGIARTLEATANQRQRDTAMSQRETISINDIRTAIRELTARAELARKEGRPDDAAELEQRISGYREQLGSRP